jgi:pimeloyl-ACP methyl ester carboxylesterase
LPRIPLPEGASVHCIADDFLWPWDRSTAVLMMHGFARNAAFWNRWVPGIAETHRVYRPDLLGCGLSDQPPPGYRYTPDTIGAQILAVLDALPLPRVHWVGESSGGIIGLLLAAAYPGRIASLVLCNTPSRIPDQIKRTYALDRASASDAMRAYGVGEWCRQTLGYRLDTERAGTELCDWVVREMDKTPREVAAAMHDCFETVDTMPLLSRVSAPVLLLSGDKSPIASAQQQALAEALPNGRVELFPGYGHGVNLLQPERCARAALEFWRGLEPYLAPIHVALFRLANSMSRLGH